MLRCFLRRAGHVARKDVTTRRLCLCLLRPILQIGDNSSQSQTSVAIQPPGPFFAIWGIIYILLSIHCVAQLRPGWTADEALRQSGWWLAAGLALTSAWGFVATLWAVTPTNAVPQQWILAVILCSMVRVRGDRWLSTYARHHAVVDMRRCMRRSAKSPSLWRGLAPHSRFPEPTCLRLPPARQAALVVKSLTILREFAESMPSLERALLLPGPSLFGAAPAGGRWPSRGGAQVRPPTTSSLPRSRPLPARAPPPQAAGSRSRASSTPPARSACPESPPSRPSPPAPAPPPSRSYSPWR